MEKKLSKRLWFNFILFGFMGQIAWNVENMYFNTFLYNSVYAGASQAAVDGSISVMSAISKMVALSAATAVITTFLMGTLSDKMRKRKLFISVGYIAWGIVTGAFGFISKDNIAVILGSSDEIRILTVTVWTVIIMDSVMTFMGSTSNDSAFNAWVTDVTNTSNRPKVESVFAILPIAAMGVVMGVGTLAQTGTISYQTFFLGLGAFVVLCGVVGLFTLEDPEYHNLATEKNSNYWSDLFYGFRPSVIKENARLYLTLTASCLYAIAVQVFFPYLLIFVQYVVLPESEGINLTSASSLIPIAFAVVFIVVAIVLLMKLANKSKSKAFIFGTICFIVGLVALGFAKGLVQVAVAAAPTAVGYVVLMIHLAATVRDFTPEGKAGLFQGIRMIFNVLLPMVIGPKLGELASVHSNTRYVDEYGVEQICPTANMFVYAAVVAVFVLIPLAILIKKGFLKNSAEKSE